MQHNIAPQDTKAERRARQVEVTLVNHNPTIDRVLEACKRIDYRQSQQSTQKETKDEYAQV